MLRCVGKGHWRSGRNPHVGEIGAPLVSHRGVVALEALRDRSNAVDILFVRSSRIASFEQCGQAKHLTAKVFVEPPTQHALENHGVRATLF